MTPYMLQHGALHTAHLHASHEDGDAAPPVENVPGGHAPDPSLNDAPSRQ